MNIPLRRSIKLGLRRMLAVFMATRAFIRDRLIFQRFIFAQFAAITSVRIRLANARRIRAWYDAGLKHFGDI